MLFCVVVGVVDKKNGIIDIWCFGLEFRGGQFEPRQEQKGRNIGLVFLCCS